MKNAKKVFAMLIVLALAISMAIPVSAADPTGKITISGVAGQTYSAYKMADLKRAGNAYSYTVADGWEAFFNKNEVKAVYTVDANGVITEVSRDAEKLAEVAKLAVEFAKGKVATKTAKANDAGKAEMTEVPYGYYCVDTTTGTVCSIGSVDGADVTIEEKNTVPSIDKSIVEGTEKLNVSDAYVGQVVKFEVVVKAYNGAENYIITDTLSPGLTFVKDENGTALAAGDKLSDFITIDASKTISIDESADSKSKRDGNTIVIDLLGEDELTKDLDKGVPTLITLTYYAKVNAQAEIDGPNPNTVSLKYGNNSDANSDKVNLYPLSFNIEKVDGTNKNAPLAGAKFKIYRLVGEGENKTPEYLNFSGSNGVYMYLGIAENEASAKEIEAKSNDVGKYVIKGLEEGTYYIKETVAPTGYNAITTDATITVSLTKNQETATATVQTKTVTIQNFTGAQLPSTGATGTIIFITVGGLMVVAMGVLLVVRKRMSKVVYTR